MAYKSKIDQAAAGRRHYQANREKMLARAKVRNKENREAAKMFVRAAKEVPCMDCKLSWPYYVMQFDHVEEGKKFNIGDGIRLNMALASIQIEMTKCEVVCANCHAIRTHERRNAQVVAGAGFEPAV